MIREPNIIEHLPLFIQEYREVQQIMTAENPEFKLVIDESEIVKNNQFIVSCDSEGIKRFEKILGISATEEPLQSRIARVLNRWNDTVPYTFNAFIEKLKTICGEGDFNIIEKFREYIIEIETHLDKYGEVDELEYLLQYIMPSNIQVISKNTWSFEILGKMGIAAGMVFVNYFELSNDFREDFTLNATARVATGLVDLKMTGLTNDFHETKEIQGDLNFGGAAIDGVKCVITDSSQESVNINSDANMGAGVDFVAIITI